jgi:hypothetical protein
MKRAPSPTARRRLAEQRVTATSNGLMRSFTRHDGFVFEFTKANHLAFFGYGGRVIAAGTPRAGRIVVSASQRIKAPMRNPKVLRPGKARSEICPADVLSNLHRVQNAPGLGNLHRRHKAQGLREHPARRSLGFAPRSKYAGGRRQISNYDISDTTKADQRCLPACRSIDRERR